MKNLRVILVSAAASVLLAGAASAASGHAHSGQGATAPQMGMMDGGMPGMGMAGEKAGGHDMMRMMMRMHAGMKGGGMGMMGGGMPGMGMMGGGMPGMGAMLPGLDADVDGDGTVTADELHETLQALLDEYDSDGSGSLSLDEFAALHAALIRETMVDRFQVFDADGDGAITAGEMTEPADRMERMQMRRMMQMKSDGAGAHESGSDDMEKDN